MPLPFAKALNEVMNYSKERRHKTFLLNHQEIMAKPVQEPKKGGNSTIGQLCSRRHRLKNTQKASPYAGATG